MQSFRTLAAFAALSFAAAVAHAAPAAVTEAAAPVAATPHKTKAACTADSKAQGLKGDARKAFIQQCAGSDAGATKTDGRTRQQQKMKTCNADAKTQGLKGDPRKAFMKECLRNK